MSNNNPSIGGFDLISGFSNPSDSNEINNSSRNVGDSAGVDPSFFDDTDIPEEVLNKINGVKTSGTKTLNDTKDDLPNIPETDPDDLQDDPNDDTNQDTNNNEDVEKQTDLSEYENDILNYVTEQFENEVGWKFEDDEKPKSVKELVDYLSKMVESNSKPDFANDEIGKLNDFVKNGGNLEDYIKLTANFEIDLEDVDINKISNQKAIIREDLKNRGYSEQKIEKTIEKFEDNNMLDEEANDALESVKEYREKNKQKLFEEQKKIDQARKTQELNFFQNVNSEIQNTKNILGLPLSDKEKKELSDFIFKKESDGTTAFQKYQVKSTTNLIESAYFAKYKDSFTKKMANTASTKAAQDLRAKLASGTSKSRNESEDSANFLNSFGNKLRRY